MELTQNVAKNESQESCNGSVNSLGACYLEHSLQQGKSIEIPSLGVVIKQPSQSKKYCQSEK